MVPRTLVALLCSAITVVAPVMTARAAVPEATDLPAETEQGTPACETTPSLDDARLMTARDLHVRGEESFRKGDYLGAVEAWTQVLVLMPDKEADLRVQLAHAHRSAYAVDGDEDHLRSARSLFMAQLESLESGDTARKDVEAEIAGIDATLADIEEAKARAQAKRDEAIRQEQIRRNDEALAAAEAEHQRNIQKIYYGVGGSLGGLGIGSLAAMTAFLSAGIRTDREGRDTASMSNVSAGRYQELLAEGEAYNRAAVATGVVGGVLTISGTSLLIVAALRRKHVVRLHDEPKVVVHPTLGGLRLSF